MTGRFEAGPDLKDLASLKCGSESEFGQHSNTRPPFMA